MEWFDWLIINTKIISRLRESDKADDKFDAYCMYIIIVAGFSGQIHCLCIWMSGWSTEWLTHWLAESTSNATKQSIYSLTRANAEPKLVEHTARTRSFARKKHGSMALGPTTCHYENDPTGGSELIERLDNCNFIWVIILELGISLSLDLSLTYV